MAFKQTKPVKGETVNTSPVAVQSIPPNVLASIAVGLGHTFPGCSFNNSGKVSKSPYPLGLSLSNQIVQSSYLHYPGGGGGQQNETS